MFATDSSTPRGGARVIRVDRNHIRIVDAAGSESAVAVTPALARLRLAVGDYVRDISGGEPSLVQRRSELSRATSAPPYTQVLAANVDLVLLAFAAPSGARAHVVERLAALGWSSGARPRFIVTKCDLVTPEDLDRVDDELARLAPGIPVTFTSVADEVGVGEVAARIAEAGTAVLIGHSGVGKSSLLNALVGADAQAVGETRARDMKGRHTTTSRELIDLPAGGCLIDTPGVRELGMDIEHHDLDRVFVEVAELAATCRFSDCTHTAEPGCSVLAAIESGDLSTERLDSMKHLEREMLHNESKREPQQRDKDREWTRHAREYRRARGR